MPTAEDTLFQRFGKEFPKGTVLFREGETGKEMFVLQSGRVVITKTVRDTVKILATLGPGEFFGEMALISNKPRNATATVDEPARLLVIDPKTFEGMIRGNSEIAVRMIKKLAERLDEADAQIENLLLADPASRVVQQILHACQSRGRPDGGGRGDRLQRARAAAADRGGRVWHPRRAGRAWSGAGWWSAPATGSWCATPRGSQDYLQLLALRWKFGDLMKLEVLGCHGGELPGCRSTCFLVDGVAGPGRRGADRPLELPALARVDHIVLTHSHFDHVKDLPAAVRPGGRLAEDAGDHLGEPHLRRRRCRRTCSTARCGRTSPAFPRRRSRSSELRGFTPGRDVPGRPATPCARCW